MTLEKNCINCKCKYGKNSKYDREHLKIHILAYNEILLGFLP